MGIISLFMGGIGLATTWTESEKIDPISGERVSAMSIGSYGSYIYDEPSKYHLIFWPLTSDPWICFNPKNGYAAFNDDFETLPDGCKASLAEWLKGNYDPADPPETYEEKLVWLERIYGQRNMNDAFWCRFYRLMACVHEDDRERSLVYVSKALPLLEHGKAIDLSEKDRLYLLGEYHRLAGNTVAAVDFLNQAAAETKVVPPPSVSTRCWLLLALGGCALLAVGICVYLKQVRIAVWIGAGYVLFLGAQSLIIVRVPKDPVTLHEEYLNRIIAERLELTLRNEPGGKNGN